MEKENQEAYVTNIKEIYNNFTSLSINTSIKKLHQNDKSYERSFQKVINLKPIINSQYENIINSIKTVFESNNDQRSSLIDLNIVSKMNIAQIMNEQLTDAFSK